MNKYYRWRLLSLVAVLAASGCATQQVPEPGPHNWRNADAGDGADAVYYYLMVGELAGQRKAFDDAVDAYQKAAELSADPKLAQRALTIAEYAQREDAALRASRLWVSLAPDNANAHLKAGLAELNSGDSGVANGHFRQYLDIQGGGFETLRTLAGEMQKSAGSDVALEVLQGLIPESGNTPASWILFGEMALAAERPALALQASDQVSELDPAGDDAVILRARALLAQGDSAGGLEQVEKALQSKPRSVGLRLTYARMLLSGEQKEAARNQYKRVLRYDSSASEALYALALLAMDDEDTVAASSYFQKTLKTGRFVDESSFYLGTLAEDRKLYQDALASYSRVRNGELAVTAQQRVAWVLAKLGRVDAARQHLETVRERSTQAGARMWLTEGEILLEEGLYQASFDVLSNAVDAFPGDHNLLYARSLSAEKLGKIEIVESDLRKLLAESPDDPVALNALGYTLANLTDRHEEALGYIERALALNPDDPATLDSMGWVLFKLGRRDEALTYLRRAFEALTDIEVAAHLGEVLWVSGQTEQAQAVWNKALAEEADDPRAEIIRRTKERLGAQ